MRKVMNEKQQIWRNVEEIVLQQTIVFDLFFFAFQLYKDIPYISNPFVTSSSFLLIKSFIMKANDILGGY